MLGITVLALLVPLASAFFLFKQSVMSLRRQAEIEQLRIAGIGLKTIIDEQIANAVDAAMVLAAQQSINNAVRVGGHIGAANDVLGAARAIYRASLVYVMDAKGTVVESVTYEGGRNILGNNYAFRPYFSNAMCGMSMAYPAVGVTTMERGIYCSAPIKDAGGTHGVVTIKLPVESIDKRCQLHDIDALLVSPGGIVFAAGHTEHLFRATGEIYADQNRQFAGVPIVPFDAMLTSPLVKIGGAVHHVKRLAVTSISERGWEIVLIKRVDPRFPMRPTDSSLLISVMVFFGLLYLIIIGLIFSVLRGTVLRRRIEEQSKELAMSHERMSQFAYIASHDLKEPLRVVINYLQLLERRYGQSLEEQAKTFIAAAVRSGDKMQQLINNLLAYARVGSEPLKIKPVNCMLILGEAKANIRVLIDEHHAVIRAEGLPVFNADPMQLVQLFQNLLSNAIKFHAPEIIPEVTVRAEKKGNLWEFSVSDNGIGMRADDADRVFAGFQRLHGHKYGGTGLGLAIAKKVTERHGGRIWLTTAEGKGTTFFFTIPAV